MRIQGVQTLRKTHKETTLSVLTKTYHIQFQRIGLKNVSSCTVSLLITLGSQPFSIRHSSICADLKAFPLILKNEKGRPLYCLIVCSLVSFRSLQQELLVKRLRRKWSKRLTFYKIRQVRLRLKLFLMNADQITLNVLMYFRR